MNINADQASQDLKITALEDGQGSGVIVFQTLALLVAHVPAGLELTASFKVTNDPQTSDNGYYSWNSSTYVKDASLVSNSINKNNTSDAVSGAAVYTNREIDFTSVNLLDESQVTVGAFIPFNGTGGLTPNASFSTSDFISLKANEELAVSHPASIVNAFGVYHYDANKVFLSVNQYPGNVIIGNVGTHYIRYTYDHSTIPQPTANYGEYLREYQPFLRSLSSSLQSVANDAMKKSVNLFDKGFQPGGAFISHSGTGGFDINPNYMVSDYIRLDQNAQLYTQGGIETSGIFGVYVYDINKNYMANIQSVNGVVTGIAGSYYIKFSLAIADRDTAQAEYDALTTYVKFGNVIKDSYIPSSSATVSNSINKNNTSDAVSGAAVYTNREIDFTSVNLLDESQATVGAFIPFNGTGGLTPNASFSTSDFISLKANEELAVSHPASIVNAFGVYHYDANKVFLSVNQYPGNVIIGNVGTHYIRYTYDHSTIPQPTANYGEYLREYQPFLRSLSSSLQSVANDAMKKSVNLFDKGFQPGGAFISHSGTGGFDINPNYMVSDYIRLDQNAQLYTQGGIETSGIFGVYVYDINKNYMANIQSVNGVVTGIAGSYYIKFSLAIADRDTAQAEYDALTTYVKFGNVIKDSYIPSSSAAVINSFTEPTYGASFLRETLKRLRAIKIGFSDSLSIAFIGDSWTAEPQWYSNLVATELKSTYGNAGAGWTGFSWWGGGIATTNRIHGNIDQAKTQVSIDSNWSSLHIQTDSPDTSSATSGTVGAEIVVTTTDEADLAYLFAQPNGAVVRYKFNAGVWTNITLNSGNKYQLNSVPSGAYSLTIEVVSGSPILNGVDMHKSGADGVKCHKLGAAGSQLAQWSPLSNDAQWRANLAELSPDTVLILLGTNDDVANESASSFNSNMSNLIENVKLATPNADILLVMPPQNIGVNSAVNAKAYADSSLALAKSKNVGFIALQSYYGINYDEYKSGSVRDWFIADGYHPTFSGGSVVNANAILDMIKE